MKRYTISFSYIFHLAEKKPWVVQCEGEVGVWAFSTEREARDFVSSKKDGKLVYFSNGEERFLKKPS